MNNFIYLLYTEENYNGQSKKLFLDEKYANIYKENLENLYNLNILIKKFNLDKNFEFDELYLVYSEEYYGDEPKIYFTGSYAEVCSQELGDIDIIIQKCVLNKELKYYIFEN